MVGRGVHELAVEQELRIEEGIDLEAVGFKQSHFERELLRGGERV